jgi:hypothetical protein
LLDCSALSQLQIKVLVDAVLIISIAIIMTSQALVQRDAFTQSPSSNVSILKGQREIDKLATEIRQIRSDTAGSLFWLKRSCNEFRRAFSQRIQADHRYVTPAAVARIL